MKVYVDLVFFLNFFFDLILLISVAIILKRTRKWYHYFLGALLGATSILFLFLPLNSISLFFLKLVISIFMVLITFGFKNIYYTLKNLFFLYSTSIILGGILYFLNVQFSYKRKGLIFFHKGLSINFIFLIIFSPLLLYIYIRQVKMLKDKYNDYYNVVISYKKKKYKMTGFFDTGNLLEDPYFKRPIVLINENIINPKIYTMIPIYTATGKSLIKCVKADYIKVDEKVYLNVSLGISNIKLDGVDCLLNKKMIGG